MGEYKTKFGIVKDAKYPKGMWSFGICLSHYKEETYIFINFFRWSISIGKLYDYNDEECLSEEFVK